MQHKSGRDSGGMSGNSKQRRTPRERRVAVVRPATVDRTMRGTHKSGTQLMRRLADSPALPALVQQLPPRSLHRLIVAVGVSDATPLMVLAPPEKLAAALDLAVWSSAQPGAAETFDPQAFTDWLEAWLEIGEAFAGERLLALGEEHLCTALAALIEVQSIHVRGFEGRYGWKLEKRLDDPTDDDDRGGFDARSAEELLHDARWHGDDLDERLRTAADRPRDAADDFDRDSGIWADASPAATSPTDHAFFGEYTVAGLVSDEWDLVLSALNALWRTDADALMAMLGRLAANPSMLALGDHRSVLRDDVARARELAQVASGFVSPLGAHAFLAGITESTLEALRDANGYDNETAQYFRRVRAAANAVTAPTDAIANDDDVALEEHPGEQSRVTPDVHDGQALAPTLASELEDLQQLLADTGVLPEPHAHGGRVRLTADAHATRADLRAAIEALAAVDPDAAAQRLQELAYLANTLVTGLRREAQATGDADAAQLALATAGLGLDWLQAQDAELAYDALRTEPGVVRMFGIGWRLLQDLPSQVIDACARGLTNQANAALLARNAWLRGEIGEAFTELQRCVVARAHAGARDALTLLSLVLDAEACRQLRPLLDEVPQLADPRGPDGQRWFASMADLRRAAEWLQKLG